MPVESGQYRNVCDIIVQNDLCAGCGVCASICPEDALKIEWNKYGEYAPVELSGKCIDCGLCLQVCPFWNQEENETTLAERDFGHQEGIQHDADVGLFLDLFAGYSKVGNHRIQGASGGLTTWLLEKLLAQGVVNRVCCVVPNNDPDTLFRFSVVDSTQDIRRASRSVYYPAEVSQVISEILSVDGKYAIVGLPCVLKGIRLAMRHNANLRKRIVVLVGLFCGQQKSKFFAEYLCALAGGEPSKLTSASFRVKDIPRHDSFENRFEFTCGSDDGAIPGHIYWSEGMGWLWGHDCFKLTACTFCDDVIGEVADVALGDAVSKAYSYGTMGANFVVVRSGLIRDLLVSGASAGEIVLDRVFLKAIRERQQGVILQKRDDLQQRLYVVHNKGNASYIPAKRFPPRQRSDPSCNRDMEMRDQMCAVSRNTYAEYRHQPDVVTQVERAIKSVPDIFTRRNRFFYLLSFIVRIMKSIRLGRKSK